MKGLLQIPSQSELAKAYARFQDHDRISEVDYAVYSQWCRFDARLAEIWVDSLARNWGKLNPTLFRNAVGNHPWPQAAAVLFEQALTYGQLTPSDKSLLRVTANLIFHGVPQAPYQDFFIGLTPFASRSLVAASERPLKSYSKWGYFGKDVFQNKFSATAGKHLPSVLSKSIRTRALDELIRIRERLTVREYQDHLQGAVSLKVAQLDLNAHPALRAVGNTRGRFYVRKKTASGPR
ncbi:MAG: hypothetical protein H7222_08105 [Methylotenera sp.]|nr:hypothetical protein [Oligoflexia bacterium]